LLATTPSILIDYASQADEFLLILPKPNIQQQHQLRNENSAPIAIASEAPDGIANEYKKLMHGRIYSANTGRI